MAVVVPCPNPRCSQTYSFDVAASAGGVRCTACGQLLRPSSDHAPGSAAASAPMPVPARIGRFRIKQRLGSGAFGAVYRAFDPRLGHDVALKVPLPAVVGNRQRLERFLREAKAAAQLRHPHVVRVFDSGKEGETYYIAAAFIEGQSLAEAIPDGGMEPQRAARLVQQLAEAVACAHQQGIVHRDIKPANVLLDRDDQPHLADFGLAVRVEETLRLTTVGSVIGTPAYMAPEQASGKIDEPQPASDQYSLGVLLYELLTDRTPFEGPPSAILYSVRHKEPTPPSQLRSLGPGIACGAECAGWSRRW